MRYRILIEQDEDGIFVAECPALPGCISQGKTRKEALVNIQDAIEGYIEPEFCVKIAFLTSSNIFHAKYFLHG